MCSHKRWAVFLDRDGVINEEVNYLSAPDQLRILPTVAQSISQLNQQNIPVVVVTNQAGVARNYFNEEQVHLVHAALRQLLASQNARIDHFYYCPHHPTAGVGSYLQDCVCRKPNPGMLLQAASDLGLDLQKSVLIGDKASDIIAGFRAGCTTILVQTGYGEMEWDNWTESVSPNYVAENLQSAIEWLFSHQATLASL
jgi:D-glycero-D-manno-heptose 1,7-bisphosphate phosphatase